ncbi:ParB/RepB/Spo0J family partition protein [Candidatus Parcubacteria bacterium]|nr:MAG: ParB/RepB/Spo0J family partition protein [Candidatus Parcubacteria bacterium]
MARRKMIDLGDLPNIDDALAKRRQETRTPIAKKVRESAEARSAHLLQTEKRLMELESSGKIVHELSTEKIRHSRFYNRFELSYQDESFQELLNSIKERGQDFPIVVRPIKDTHYEYEVVAGNRRLEACRKLGIPIKVFIKHLDDLESELLNVRENLEREDISVFELYKKFKDWMRHGLVASQNEIAQRIGRTKGWVSQVMIYDRIPEQVFEALQDPRIISFRNGRLLAELAKAPSERVRLIELAEQLKYEDLPDSTKLNRMLLLGKQSRQASTVDVRHLKNAKGHVLATLKKTTKGYHLVFNRKVTDSVIQKIWEILENNINEINALGTENKADSR